MADTIVLTTSADGDAQFTVDVNGQQVGGTYDVTAQHGAGQTAAATQDITLPGTFDTSGPFQLSVNFLNQADGDLYVESATFGSQTILGNQAVMNPGSTNPGADPTAAVMFEDGTATFNLNDTPPTTTILVAQEQTIGPNQTVALSNLFSANEPDGNPITQYNVYEGSMGTPVGTVTDANNNTITDYQNDTVSSLAGMTYNSSTNAGQDRLWVQAYADGQWGNWTYVDMNNTGSGSGTGTGGGSTGGSGNVALTMSADGDAQFTVDVNGQQVGGTYDVTAQHGAGQTAAATQDITLPGTFDTSSPVQVTVNFLNQANADLFIESATIGSQTLAGNTATMNPGSTNPGADPNAAVMFEDGSATFNGGTAQTTGGNTPPTTTIQVAQEQTIGPNQTVALSGLFSANEPDGDPITQYNVYEGSLGTPVGTVTDANNNTIATYQNDTVTSLNGMTYNSSTNAGQDRLWVQAYADGQWGNWAYVDMNNTGAGSGGGTGTGGGSTASGNIMLTMSADGDAQFTVDVNGQQVGGTYDVTAQHGTGQTAAATQDITLPGTFDTSSPVQLTVNFLNQATADLFIESATIGSQTLAGNAATMNPGSTNPGADPSAAVMFEDGSATFSTGTTPPTTSILVAQEQTVGPNQTVALSSLFSANESDGDPITQYNVYEGSMGTPVGTVTDGAGNTIATYQNDTVTSLDGMNYNSSTNTGQDRIWVQAYADGQWGNWAYVDMNNSGGTPPQTSILVAQEQSIGPNQTVALSSLFSATEADGSPITQYNVYEGSMGTPVGTVTDGGGNTIATYQNDTVTSLNGMNYNSSTNAGQDRIWVQAYAEGQWGNWTYVDMNNTGSGSGTGGGSGNSTIALTLSSDGDAQFTVDVNGQQVNGVYDVTAQHGAGQTAAATQNVTISGDFGSTGPSQVAINFLNQATADLFVESVDVNGNVIQGNQAVMNPASVNPGADPSAAVMYENGTATFNTSGSPPTSQFIQAMAGTSSGSSGTSGGSGQVNDQNQTTNLAIQHG